MDLNSLLGWAYTALQTFTHYANLNAAAGNHVLSVPHVYQSVVKVWIIH